MKEAKLILNSVKRLLGQEVKLETANLDNGTVLEADMFEAGSPVFIVTEDGQVPLPIGDYTMEDGRMLVVAEDGIIAEVKEAAAEESPEVEVEVEAGSEPEYVTKEDFLAAIGEIKSLFTSQLEMKAAEEVEVETEKEVELSAAPVMPAATPIKPNPERENARKEQFTYSKKQSQTLDAKLMAKFSNLNLKTS